MGRVFQRAGSAYLLPFSLVTFSEEVPETPYAVDEVLNKKVALYHGDSESWLFSFLTRQSHDHRD